MNALIFSRWGNGIVDFEIFLTMFGWMACDSKRSGHRLARLCYSRWPRAPGLLSGLCARGGCVHPRTFTSSQSATPLFSESISGPASAVPVASLIHASALSSSDPLYPPSYGLPLPATVRDFGAAAGFAAAAATFWGGGTDGFGGDFPPDGARLRGEVCLTPRELAST
jgi:hypothetical protein